MHRHTWYLGGALAAGFYGARAERGEARRAPVAVRCDPGGACTSPAAPALREVTRAAGLADLAAAPLPGVRREVRVWASDAPPTRGRLRRFVEDTAGRVTAEETVWWSAAPAHASTRFVCGPVTVGTRANVALCPTERVGMPYAANRFRALAARGVWGMRGQAGAPPRSARCFDACMGPGYVVVELREGRRYRTYGYPVGSGTRPPDAAFTLLHTF